MLFRLLSRLFSDPNRLYLMFQDMREATVDRLLELQEKNREDRLQYESMARALQPGQLRTYYEARANECDQAAWDCREALLDINFH